MTLESGASINSISQRILLSQDFLNIYFNNLFCPVSFKYNICLLFKTAEIKNDLNSSSIDHSSMKDIHCSEFSVTTEDFETSIDLTCFNPRTS